MEVTGKLQWGYSASPTGAGEVGEDGWRGEGMMGLRGKA